MPEIVRLHDPQPPSQERHLGLYGPHSPGSDSPLSLVVRKEERRKLGTYPVDSPGQSSGFSDGSGSYESSPNRSPSHGQDSGQPPYDAGDSDKPLCLVRKNLTLFQREAGSSKYSGKGNHSQHVPPKKKWRQDEDAAEVVRNYHDSGNEEEDEPALVISEQVVDDEQETNRVTEDTVYDFSTPKKTDDDAFGGKKEKPTGIKIKDFARLDMPAAAVENKEDDAGLATEAEEEGVESEPESDCASISSVDTWSSSLGEGKPFSGTDAVIRRIRRTSSGDPVYQCDFCDKLFGNKYHLQSHLVTHTGERAFTCRTCKKTFGRKSTLRAHMTTHTKVSNFMCTVCEKACNDNNSLEEHMRMHTGEKPFVCTICQKAYARKSHLNVHYRVHTGERPFVCDFCHKDFTEKRFLNDHMQTAHNGLEGPLKCPNCAREFAYKTSLKQHLKKQMCERNMKRSYGNMTASSVAKQFQCPFCDKSYSWKQTLKQHVSMYHRNKVHTDEFWRHELSKNKRTIVDDVANQELWEQQLGKHAEETAQLKKEAAETAAAAELQGSGSRSETPVLQEEQAGSWLDQVRRSSTPATPATPPLQEPVTTEMKLMALQNLQSSLHFMSMGMSGPQLAAMTSLQRLAGLQTTLAEAPVKLEPAAPPQDGYLALLAQLAQKESEDRFAATSGESGAPGVARPPALLPAKEESAVKRTQMWLQQVNKYRHKPPKEELDANHEQLWEQQISRVKRNPVRSPLEPVEIVIEDDGEKSSYAGSPRHHTIRTSHSRRSTITNNNNNHTITTNNNNHTIANNNHTITNNNNHMNNNNHTITNNNNNIHHHEGVVVFQAKVGLAPHPSSLVFPAVCHTPPRPATPLAAATPPPSRYATPLAAATPPPSRAATPSQAPEEGGLLKSLLLDRTKRKRSSSKETEPSPKKPASPLVPVESPSDILRKRLMGFVEPPPAAPEAPRRSLEAASRPEQPAARRPSEAPRRPSEDPRRPSEVPRRPSEVPRRPSEVPRRPSEVPLPQAEGQLPQEKATAGGSAEQKDKEAAYSKTSVLKHLLHRYTGTNQ